MENRDFRGRNLRNHDFAGRSLAGADFRDTDIRGTDFSAAELRGARFSRSRGGVPPLWAALVIAVALLLASLLGVVAALATSAMGQRLSSGEGTDRLAVLVIAAIGFAMITTAVFRDIRQAALVGVVVSAAVFSVVIPLLLIQGDFSAQAAAISIIWLVAIFGTFIVGALARAAAGIISPTAFLIVAAAGALTARNAGGAIFAILIAIAAVVFARRALANPGGAGRLHASTRGLVLGRATTYRRADLTDAEFTDAVTGPSDFTDADITGATFEGATVTRWGKLTPDRLLKAARNDAPR
jgi:uncharacterized protein YjbI with pentapeptide repeats